MPNSDEARRLRQYHEEHDGAFAAWAENGYPHGVVFPAIPDDLRGLTCAAKTRAGTPCKQTSIYLNGRCKLHGGLSTGPKTDAGKASARANLGLRWSEPHERL